MDAHKIFSLDLETSTDDSSTGSILSIAIVNMGTGQEIYREIHYPEGVFCKPEAMAVNRLDITKMHDRSKTLKEVSAEIYDWLSGYGFPSKHTKLMGSGVSYFDKAFLDKQMPFIWKFFTRRIFELNGLRDGLAFMLDRDPLDFMKETKEAAEAETVKRLPGVSRHHALFDAWMNVFELRYIDAKYGNYSGAWVPKDENPHS